MKNKKQITVNLEIDDLHFRHTGKTTYRVMRPEGQPTGFSNKFNQVIEGKQAEQVQELLDMQAKDLGNVCAFHDGRFSSGLRFEIFG